MEKFRSTRSFTSTTRAILVASLLCVAFTIPGTLYAQSSANAVEFEIEAQSLAQALRDFARQAGAQVLYDPDDVAGRKSTELLGNFEPAEALTLLLAGTDLIVEQTDGRTFTIARRPAENTAVVANPAPPRPVIEELTVTASRREKPINRLPMSVTVLSGDALLSGSATDMAWVANWLPSLQVSDLSPLGGEHVLRGLKSTGTGGRTVDFLIDGATAGSIYNATSAAVLDYERLEVIRGSQGTFYGASSLSGTIKLVSARPRLDVLEGHAGVGGWSTDSGDETWKTAAVVNLPVVADTFALRFGASHEDSGGFIDIYTADPDTLLPDQLIRRNGNSFERTAIRAAALWRPSARFEAYLTARNQSLTNPWPQSETLLRTPPGGDRLEPLEDHRAAVLVGRLDGEPELEEDLATLELNYDFDAATLVSESTIYDTDFEAILRTGDFQSTDNIAEQSNRSQEFRLLSADNERFEWLVGAYWREEDSEESVASEDTSTQFASDFRQSVVRKQEALFGHLKYRVNRWLSLELGLRHSREDLERSRITRRTVDGAPLPTSESEGSDSYDVTVPRVAAMFDVADNAIVYASYSEGFRGGAINSLSVGPENLRSAEPDVNSTYEIGWKGVALRGKFRGSLVLFHNDWDDIQVRVVDVVDGQLASFVVNGDAASSTGLEFELAWQPLDVLSLSASGHYMETELKSTVRGGQLAFTDDIEAGAELPEAPRYSLAIGAEYSRPLTGEWLGYLRADVLARAGSYSDLANDPVTKTESFQTGRIHVGMMSRRWDLSIFGDNVWNERANLRQLPFPVFISPVSGNARVITPRRIGLTVRYQF